MNFSKYLKQINVLLLSTLAFTCCIISIPLAQAIERVPPIIKPFIQIDDDPVWWGVKSKAALPGLGAYPAAGEGKYSWCHTLGVDQIDFDSKNTFTINNISTVTGNYGGKEYAVTQAQMAYILHHYQDIKTDTSRAGIAFLVHANFETRTIKGRTPMEKVQRVKKWLTNNRPDVLSKAKQYVAEARKSGWDSYSKIEVVGEGKRLGDIHGLGIKNQNGKFIADVPMKVVIKGPAKFIETGTNTWEGKTKGEPITLKWEATGNGTVTWKSYFPKTTLRNAASKTGRQDMILSASGNPKEEVPGPSFKVVYDFQPIGLSQVDAASIPSGLGKLTDTITVSADSKYVNPNWLEGVSVKYEAEVYYLGQTLPDKPKPIPTGTKPVATASVTAPKPGKYSATVKANKPGFYTWVWKVVKANQGRFKDRIHADWSDKYLTETETQVQRYEGKISSKNNLIGVHGGTDAKFFLNDWIHISGFPANHGDFKGYGAIKPDVKEVQHELYCVKGKVREGITKTLKPLWSATTPARNGDYRIADMFPNDPGLHVQDIDCRGTLIWVSSFTGDGRVEPLRTSDMDSTESYNPTPPSMKTTALDKTDGDKYLPPKGEITITDTVKYSELATGKPYTLTASLMDKASGKPLTNEEGKPITTSKKFTPTHRNGIVKIDIPVKAELLYGKTTVVFEKMTRPGREPIIHADINDENQTLYSPKLHTTATTGGSKLVDLSKPTVIIEDKVEYTSLQPGATYTLIPTLMNQDGTPVAGVEAKPFTFTAKKSGKGSITLTMSIPSNTLKQEGKTTWVVFEELHLGNTPNGKIITEHKDLNDTEQTIHYQPLPATGTTSTITWITLFATTATMIGIVIKRNRVYRSKHQH